MNRSPRPTRAELLESLAILRSSVYSAFVAGLADPWLVARFRRDLANPELIRQAKKQARRPPEKPP